MPPHRSLGQRSLGLLLLPAALLLGCAPAQTGAAQTGGAQTQPGAAQAELPRGEIQVTPVRQSPEDFQRDLAPHRGQMEWWYVSSSLPEQGLALHWALFKVEVVGRTIFFSHVAVTDLKTNTVKFVEARGQSGAGVGFPPLVATQDGNTLTQIADGFALKTPDLDLTLRPLKAAVRHPASGTPQTGQMEYQSVTRLALSGTVKGATVQGTDGPVQQVSGSGWLDHQWGDQFPGQNAFWDWMGLQVSDGSELMLYRVRDAAGNVLQTYGTRVGADGEPVALSGLKMEPLREWKSPLGRSYLLDWKLSGGGLNLNVTAPHNEQELVSKNTGVTYWEGPLSASGTQAGQAVTASGMGEFLSGPPKP